MSPHDHDMIYHAARRGAVVVVVDGRPIEATLIAWRPRRKPRPDGEMRGRRNYARVEFLTGRQRTVKCDTVSILLAAEAVSDDG